jgi:hypothetical protein
MGWINWIFDIYQHDQIGKARAAASRAEMAAVRAGGGVDAERLQGALEELALAVKTVQRALVEKGVCSADELRRTMRAIDKEDGREDGRSPIG